MRLLLILVLVHHLNGNVGVETQVECQSLSVHDPRRRCGGQ
jgi:hypothetical protein